MQPPINQLHNQDRDTSKSQGLYKSYKEERRSHLDKRHLVELQLRNRMKKTGFVIDAKKILRQQACFICQDICEVVKILEDVKRNDHVKLFRNILNSLQRFIQGRILEVFN